MVGLCKSAIQLSLWGLLSQQNHSYPVDGWYWELVASRSNCLWHLWTLHHAPVSEIIPPLLLTVHVPTWRYVLTAFLHKCVIIFLCYIFRLKLIFFTEWLWSHITHFNIFIHGCSSVQCNWINKHTILLWLYKSPHKSYYACNLLVPVHQLSSNIRSARLCFLQVQWISIVEHYLASHFYLTCHSGFRDIFFDYPAPNNSMAIYSVTVSFLMSHFH